MIKTWEERLTEVSDESIVTSLAVQFAMQDEIDELRAKLAEYGESWVDRQRRSPLR